MAPSGRDLSQQLIDGRYRVEYRLGRGGMGSVWSVQHVESLKRFALKTLESGLAADAGARDRLLREARAASALRSRHVVQVVDSQTNYVHNGEPLPYLVMERLDGLTLEQWLSTRGPLSQGQVVWLMRQVGRALSAAHDHGIIHRDLKPSNVFLTVDDEGTPLAKLCDFGIAKLTASAAVMLLNTSGAQTSTGDFLGTPLYLAPELLRGATHATAATDQWALGLTVFKALTGREYFDGVASGPDLVFRIAQDPLPAPTSLAPALPPIFDAWFLRSCARVPERRYDTVAAQIQALEAALAPAESEAVPIGAVELSDTTPAWAMRPREEPVLVAQAPGKTDKRLRPGLVFAVVWAIGGTAWLLQSQPSLEWGTALARQSAEPTPPSAAGIAAPAPVSPRLGAATVQEPESPSKQQPPEILVAPADRESVALPAVSQRSKPRTSAPTSSSKAPPAAQKPTPPATARKLKAGQACRRSAECESGLCVAEECR